jgi:Domain of unknown function (DUF4326)
MEVVNVKVARIRPKYCNLKKWVEDSDNVYIGRKGVVFVDGKRFPEQASPFANPFKITPTCSREKVLQMYTTYITDKIQRGEVDLLQLVGKRLGCWCAPKACHGDVLVNLLNL